MTSTSAKRLANAFTFKIPILWGQFHGSLEQGSHPCLKREQGRNRFFALWVKGVACRLHNHVRPMEQEPMSTSPPCTLQHSHSL